jgi:hypothetical protein
MVLKGVINMERKIGEIWKVKVGSKTLWKMQCPKGIDTFTSKRRAEEFQRAFKLLPLFKEND